MQEGQETQGNNGALQASIIGGNWEGKVPKDSLILLQGRLAQITDDETISYLRNYETDKAKYLREEKEQQEIKMQKNKLESELKNLQEKSKYVSFYDTDRVYEKFEETLDKLTREL